MRFNMKTGEASQKQLSVIAVDFPRINESYTGRKQRYVYCMKLSSRGIIKFDLEAEPASTKDKLEVGGNVAGVIDLGPGRYGSEAIFVPHHPGVAGDEDDGYLIFFVHDENTGYFDALSFSLSVSLHFKFDEHWYETVKQLGYKKSELNVMDAKTMSAKPVAVVDLPARVPFGLHAYFISEEQIKSQVVAGNT
ncbi:hypothetical protein LUZ63_005914 [Rhynchospora breviuscula]|uniref:carotenoid 9,10-dioxygenase n=1 Tax=Rhynchospora breviuscula TaxID=2022672 RepID=A0A9Q0CPF7_9POAL|nr:hypothetical protein LUZ63_005914 [Rhynchospora breviuscula]